MISRRPHRIGAGIIRPQSYVIGLAEVYDVPNYGRFFREDCIRRLEVLEKSTEHSVAIPNEAASFIFRVACVCLYRTVAVQCSTVWYVLSHLPSSTLFDLHSTFCAV